MYLLTRLCHVQAVMNSDLRLTSNFEQFLMRHFRSS